jgi:hypothetical protein
MKSFCYIILLLTTASAFSAILPPVAFSQSLAALAAIRKKHGSKLAKTALNLSPAIMVRGGASGVVLQNFYGDALGEFMLIRLNNDRWN